MQTEVPAFQACYAEQSAAQDRAVREWSPSLIHNGWEQSASLELCNSAHWIIRLGSSAT